MPGHVGNVLCRKTGPPVVAWIVAGLHLKEVVGYKGHCFPASRYINGERRYSAQLCTVASTKCVNHSYNMGYV